MSDDNREMYRPTEVRSPASKRCDICESFGTHHTDRCPSLDEDQEADPVFVAKQLAEARALIENGDAKK